MTDPVPDRPSGTHDPMPVSVVGWLTEGAIDAPLAAVIWLLVEGGVPLVVASEDAAAADSLAVAFEAFGRRPPLVAAFPASLAASSLEEVQARLGDPPYGLTEDAIRSVGVVIVLRILSDGRRRVGAAHYVRPLEQDPHGHVQRRPPALLAAWDGDTDRFDDYAWGITAELAGRIGREPVAFERLRAERAVLLDRLVAGPDLTPAAVERALLAAGRPPGPTH